MRVDPRLILWGAAAVALFAGAFYVSRKVGAVAGTVVDAVEAVAPYVNPADDRNLINQGVTWVGKTVTGKDSWSLGTAIYDQTHNGNSLWDLVNPTDDDNIIYGSYNLFGRLLSGDEDWSLGTAIYDWTH